MTGPAHAMRLSAVLFLLICCAACKTPDRPENPPPPLVIAESKPETQVPLPLENLLFNARQLIVAGDYAGALQELDAAPASNSPPEQVRERSLLRTEARRHLLQSRIVDVWVQVPSVPVALGDNVSAELVIANIGATVLTIRARKAASGSSSAFRIEMLCEEFPADGTRIEHKLITTLNLSEDLVLEPSRRHAFPFSIDTLEVSPTSPTVRMVTIAATLHTSTLYSEGAEQRAALIFRPSRLLVLPRNWEQLTTEPLRQLDRVLERGAYEHLPVVLALLSEDQRPTAIARLQKAQSAADTSPAMQTSILAALVLCRRLTERVGFPAVESIDRQIP